MKTQNCILHILWLIFLLLAVSCAPSRDKKNTLELSFWGSPEEVKIVNRSMKDFKERHPDVRVNATHIPAQGYLEKILTRAAADNLPDIMFMEVGFIDQFVDKNMVKDLTPLIKADKDYSIKDYFPKILNRFTFGDRIYGLPRDVAPFACIYYNKNMLKQAGLEMPADDWTLRKFVEYGKKLTREKKGKKQWGFFCWAWGNFLYTFGGRYVDNNKNPTKAVINSTETRKAINFYKDLMYKHKMMPMPGSVDINQAQAFMTGQVAMYLSGIWESPAFREIHDFDWDVVMFPRHP
ncbi:MAG TPA: sugar ABC transporter substrate-binding protein, partial [Spirochaetota bacterium]|nr:sugar ABC transporter substrate-binding protein [Spirochaetota bacterium]